MEKTTTTKHLWVKDIKENDEVKGDYLVKNKTVSQTKQGNPFLTLLLADKTGIVEARVWDKADDMSAQFKEGDVISISGQANIYKNKIQININKLKQNNLTFNANIFQESTQRDTGQMLSELKRLSQKINNRHLRGLVSSFLLDNDFITKFKKAPAAKHFHHCYLGGLLEHTLSVSQMAVKIAKHYPELDSDILLSGAILHDIGKVNELIFDRNIEYSDEGRLLGHIVLGVMMLDEKLNKLKEFPAETATLLKHLILSHHGEFDFGSPKRPKFLEAFALHLIDDMDAKINGLNKLFREDKQEGSWTYFNNLFQRYFYKGNLHSEAKDKDKDRNEKEPAQRHLFPLDL